MDYSYQDDYCMEDMTAPDTMINFSARPQQPNYYQLPQSAAHENVNLNFNMTLHGSGTGQPSTPTAFPAHAHANTSHNPVSTPVNLFVTLTVVSLVSFCLIV